MLPLILAGAGLGAGLLKSELIDKPKEERQRKLAAETQRYSPWTGMQAGNIQQADPIGSAVQFGTTGAMMGQGIEGMGQQDKLIEAQTGLADAQKSVYGQMMNGNSLNAGQSIATNAGPGWGYSNRLQLGGNYSGYGR